MYEVNQKVSIILVNILSYMSLKPFNMVLLVLCRHPSDFHFYPKECYKYSSVVYYVT